MESAQQQVLNALDSIWPSLSQGLGAVFNTTSTHHLTHSEYVQLYTLAYNYCTNSKLNNMTNRSVSGASNNASGGVSNSSSNSSAPAQRGAYLVGKELYDRYNQFLTDHLAQQLGQLQATSRSTLLSTYAARYSHFVAGSKTAHNMLQYLNRHWIRRETDEGNPKIYPLYNLALVLWRQQVILPLQSGLIEALIEAIQNERRGASVDSTVLKQCVQSYVECGSIAQSAGQQLHQQYPSSQQQVALGLYKESIEKPLLQATRQFYLDEAKELLQSMPVTEYMKKVEMRLQEEELRVQRYLHATSRRELIRTCEEALIETHQSILIAQMMPLLEQTQFTDLSRLYQLMQRLEQGLVPLRSQFETFVRAYGEKCLQNLTLNEEDESQQAKQVMDTFIMAHNHVSQLAKDSFQSEAGFMAALDRACRDFMNRNRFTQQQQNTSSRTAEWLAKYCDQLLRTKQTEDTALSLEEQLTRNMIVFKYLEDKDVFQKFYWKMLSKRLIYGVSVSEDAEASMISKLKEACGYDYTVKLQRMFQDMGVNRDMNEQFQAHCRQLEVDSSLDFSAWVLATGVWPIQVSTTPFQLPLSLQQCLDRFNAFYQHKHQGRLLKWVPAFSRGEMRATFGKLKYTFSVSTHQMALLLAFNQKESYSVQELMTLTLLESETILGHLRNFCKSRLFSQQGDGVTAVFTLNADFKSKKLRMNLNVPLKNDIASRQESEETQKSAYEDRKYVIDAAVVRIMKSRKRMKHTALISEVLTQLATLFKPSVPDIKKCIEVLIDKEYMERVEGQSDTLQYKA